MIFRQLFDPESFTYTYLIGDPDTREAALIELLESCGFVDVQLHDRHGYSWTAIGTRPEKEAHQPSGATP